MTDAEKKKAIDAGVEAFYRMYEDELQDLDDCLRCAIGVALLHKS